MDRRIAAADPVDDRPDGAATCTRADAMTVELIPTTIV